MFYFCNFQCISTKNGNWAKAFLVLHLTSHSWFVFYTELGPRLSLSTMQIFTTLQWRITLVSRLKYFYNVPTEVNWLPAKPQMTREPRLLLFQPCSMALTTSLQASGVQQHDLITPMAVRIISQCMAVSALGLWYTWIFFLLNPKGQE